MRLSRLVNFKARPLLDFAHDYAMQRIMLVMNRAIKSVDIALENASCSGGSPCHLNAEHMMAP